MTLAALKVRFSLVPSYVHEPNFIAQRWSSNGNQRMSMAHDEMKMPSGVHLQRPSDQTCTSVRKLLSIASCALAITTNTRAAPRSHHYFHASATFAFYVWG